MTIYAFEPTPNNFDHMKTAVSHLSESEGKRILCFPYAIGEQHMDDEIAELLLHKGAEESDFCRWLLK